MTRIFTEMVVQNFLLLVLSSFFQIPSFSPVCSSSVFSFSVKIFQTLSLYSYLFIFLFSHPLSSICVPYCPLLCLSRHFYHFTLCQFPRFYFFLFFFSTFSRLPSWLIFPVFYSFPFSVPVPPSSSCLLPLSCCIISAGWCQHAAPPTSNQALTLLFPTVHLRTCSGWVCELRHWSRWVYELMHNRFWPLISEGLLRLNWPMSASLRDAPDYFGCLP